MSTPSRSGCGPWTVSWIEIRSPVALSMTATLSIEPAPRILDVTEPTARIARYDVTRGNLISTLRAPKPGDTRLAADGTDVLQGLAPILAGNRNRLETEGSTKGSIRTARSKRSKSV
jgi:hypothetical protein